MTAPRMLQAEGNPIWFDLVSSHADASMRFYSDLLSWEFESIDMGGGNSYHLAVDNDRNVAGIGNRPPDIAVSERESFWLTHLYTSDVYSISEKVVSRGGSLITEAHDVQVPGQEELVGARCTLRNPAGGVFSLWQSGVGQGCEVFGEPGTFCWVEYHTSNAEAATQWHSSVFDVSFIPVEVEESDGSGSSTLHMMQCGTNETSCAFVEVPADRMLTEVPFWMNYVMVSDMDESVGRAKELGAKVPFGVGAIPFGKYATIIDPQGAVLGLWQSED